MTDFRDTQPITLTPDERAQLLSDGETAVADINAAQANGHEFVVLETRSLRLEAASKGHHSPAAHKR